MRIGELAAQVGVSVQAVRYYERRGLLPAPDRTPAGYREYGEHDLLRLRFIRETKGLGFTLTEILELLDLRVRRGTTVDDVRRRAAAKVATTRARIRDLRRIERTLHRLVSACERGGDPGACTLMRALHPEQRHQRRTV